MFYVEQFKPTKNLARGYMRRDYFTCVFLGLIAGALTFVCFSPLYFTYDAVIPRNFSLFERFMSVLYTLFFVFFLPFFAAFKKKEWVNWGLAAYGLMAYLPLWFYPAQALDSPSFCINYVVYYSKIISNETK